MDTEHLGIEGSNLLAWLWKAFVSIALYVWYEDKKETKIRFKILEERVKENQESFSAYKEIAGEKYVTRAELKDDMADFKDLLHRIEDKLDRKVDRHEFSNKGGHNASH